MNYKNIYDESFGAPTYIRKTRGVNQENVLQQKCASCPTISTITTTSLRVKLLSPMSMMVKSANSPM